MPQLRVALAQVDPVVGDIAGNVDMARASVADAAQQGAHLVVLPEMHLTGYPPEDLVLRRSFVAASLAALPRLAESLAAEGLGDVAVILGYLGHNGVQATNSCALLHEGRVVATYDKHHLPNYGVFDEERYFASGCDLAVVRLHGIDVAMTICEDLWQDGGPFAAARAAGAGLVTCINGSPYERNKEDVRLELCQRRAAEAGATLVYVNMVGGQDELVFDGDSMVVTAGGEVLARGPQFATALVCVDLDLPAASSSFSGDAGEGADGMTVSRVVASEAPVPSYEPVVAPTLPRLDELEEIWSALVLGTRDYARKNGFRTVLVGLSGGIDSALVATIAADAIGGANVHVVSMPSRHSTPGSVSDARELADRQRLQWISLPIGDVVAAYEQAYEPLGGLHGLAAENLQARIRGTAWMGLSNEFGHLMLTGGNKSEIATGFSTLYGDTAGGFAPIKDVPKTLVWELARWRNAKAVRDGQPEPIPVAIITKAPSAELAPGQLDEDRLPPYELLDRILDDYVERDRGREELVAAGYDPRVVDDVIRLVDLAEWKRRQYPPGPKISPKNFGRDRRLPITNRWREPAP